MTTLAPHALVSIIIPTYRRPVAVRAAVESALLQTWPSIEIVVVSDGPDPVTRAVIAELGSRVRYRELPANEGPAAARNAGVAASQGEWLCFLDDDDLMLPNKVEVQLAMARAEQRWCMVACRTIYCHGSRQDVWPERELQPGEDLADYLLLRPTLLGRPGVVPLQSLLMHRTVPERVPFSSHRDHEDWAWLLEVWYRHGARILFAWEALVIYNIETEGMSRSRRMNWEDSTAWAKRHREWIGNRAFCSFLATKAAFKARRARDWKGLREIARLVVTNGPGVRELLFLTGSCLLPGFVLQDAWKKSLRRRRKSVATTGVAERPLSPAVRFK